MCYSRQLFIETKRTQQHLFLWCRKDINNWLWLMLKTGKGWRLILGRDCGNKKLSKKRNILVNIYQVKFWFPVHKYRLPWVFFCKGPELKNALLIKQNAFSQAKLSSTPFVISLVNYIAIILIVYYCCLQIRSLLKRKLGKDAEITTSGCAIKMILDTNRHLISGVEKMQIISRRLNISERERGSLSQ